LKSFFGPSDFFVDLALATAGLAAAEPFAAVVDLLSLPFGEEKAGRGA